MLYQIPATAQVKALPDGSLAIQDANGHWHALGVCPGCSGRVVGCDCEGCGGLIAHGIDRAASYLLVGGQFDPQSSDLLQAGEGRYFDLSGPENGGWRRHGWYNPKTGLLLQVG